ncbi:MAG: mannose-1-phosphate guanylyltransferase/mannose-6-phosphate isomerase, partial [Spongiibacteraceae bacterium]
MLIPVLLSGGVGSRLWPVSRESYPKQFLPMTGVDSLLVQTLRRSGDIVGVADPILVCNEDHRFIVAEQLRGAGVKASAILLEPVGRNTAPAVAAAALQALTIDPKAVLLVLPADHVIQQPAAFADAVVRGLPAAEAGALVTFGIVPNAPETGYGYIRCGEKRCGEKQGDNTFVLREFVEKPDLATAQGYLSSGDYYWNSGMFLLRADIYLSELESFAPAMLTAVRDAIGKARTDLDFIRLDAEAFKTCPSDSIDYAVMEHTTRGAVVPLDCGWSDVGSWSSLWDVETKDEQSNASSGDVLLHDTDNTYVRAESRLVATVGVTNLIVVETSDAVLVADKSRVQDV